MAIAHTKHRPAEWRVFPATKTVAFYDSFAQYIELSEIDSAELVTALSQLTNEPKKSLGCLPVLFHELRHWVDHIATVWGQQRLVAGFDAMNARRLNRPEEFWRITEYLRCTGTDTFGKYFRTVEQATMPKGAKPIWMFQFTSGMRFDQNGRLNDRSPIFFTRYAWSDGSMACRVPFSVSSLLETAAMHTEMGVENILLSGLDKVERKIEENRRHDRHMQGLYDGELAVYSTAVHTVANRMNLSAANHAYPLASALASFCLNLSNSMFDRLIIPSEFEQIWGARNLAALKGRDRGYAYLLLLYHGDKKLVDEPIKWVQSAATKAGLPSFSDIAAVARTERAVLAKSAIDGPYRGRLGALMSIGDSIFEKLGVSFTLDSLMPHLPEIVIPPILCSDMKWHSLGAASPKHDPDEVEKWCMECIGLEKQFDEFMAACGR